MISPRIQVTADSASGSASCSASPPPQQRPASIADQTRRCRVHGDEEPDNISARMGELDRSRAQKPQPGVGSKHSNCQTHSNPRYDLSGAARTAFKTAEGWCQGSFWGGSPMAVPDGSCLVTRWKWNICDSVGGGTSIGGLRSDLTSKAKQSD